MVIGSTGTGGVKQPGCVNLLHGKLDDLQTQVRHMYDHEFSDSHAGKNGMSLEDKQAMSQFDNQCEVSDGHFQIPLPWKGEVKELPNNKHMASHRLASLKRRLERDPELHGKYSDFMSSLIAKGHAEPLPRDVPDNQRVWYLRHHSVTNPKKPEKVRVVFDAAAKYQGTSLNESLMQGPDLTNNLVGVLLRFRLETIAVAADIESMFYEVKVPKQDRDSMRFLWWPNGDLSRDPDEYRMSVHIFVGRSSPSCAGYALQRAGKEICLIQMS